MPTLRRLLANGDISPLKMSMSSIEAHSVIGPYDGIYECDEIIIEKHGPFQLEFCNGKLSSMKWILANDGHSDFQVTECMLDVATTVETFLDYCDELAIPWTLEQAMTFDRQLAFRTSEEVVVIFDLDRRELQCIVVRNTQCR